jgi:hypothetical protein
LRGWNFGRKKHMIEYSLSPRTRSEKVLKERLTIMNGIEDFYFKSTMTIG